MPRTPESIWKCKTERLARLIKIPSLQTIVESKEPRRVDAGSGIPRDAAVDIHSEVPPLVLSESDALASLEIFYALPSSACRLPPPPPPLPPPHLYPPFFSTYSYLMREPRPLRSRQLSLLWHHESRRLWPIPSRARHTWKLNRFPRLRISRDSSRPSSRIH